MEMLDSITLNGEKYGLPKGDKGDSIFVRYSNQPSLIDSTETWEKGQRYIGVAVGQTAPTQSYEYQWMEIIKDNLIPISGVWVFKDNFEGFFDVRQEDFNFTSGGTKFTGFDAAIFEGAKSIIFFNDDDSIEVYNDGWVADEEYKTIDFGTVPQLVSPEFLLFMETFVTSNEFETALEEAKKTAEDLNAIFGDIDTALDSIIAIQNELIENGATPAAVYTISGRWQFNEKAKAELGVMATHELAKTDVNFTSGGIEFVAIDCSESSCQYWGADGTQYPIHESGMFDCYGLGDDVLDFGEELQVVTEEFLAWIDYYMI